MTIVGAKKKDARKKNCHAIAKARARQARRKGSNPFLVFLVFVWAFLASVLSAPRLGFPSPKGSIPSRLEADRTAPDERPINDYERGLSGPFKHRPRPGMGRYRARPSMARLMADLRRPAARADAAAALAARITDPAVRAWVATKIADHEFNKLSIYVRPGRGDETILAAWRGEVDAEIEENEATKRAADDHGLSEAIGMSR